MGPLLCSGTDTDIEDCRQTYYAAHTMWSHAQEYAELPVKSVA